MRACSPPSRRAALAALAAVGGLLAWAAVPPAPATAVPSTDIQIHAVATRGPAGAVDEGIELVNISLSAQIIDGWQIAFCTGSGQPQAAITIPANTALAPGGFYLLINAGSPVWWLAQQVYHGDISDTGGVQLSRPGANQPVDSIGMQLNGACTETLSALPQTPDTDPQCLANVRVNTIDTDVNAADFQQRTRPWPCQRPWTGGGVVEVDGLTVRQAIVDQLNTWWFCSLRGIELVTCPELLGLVPNRIVGGRER